MFDFVQHFLDNWSPWHLRGRINCLEIENNNLNNQLDSTLLENRRLTNAFIESVKKMHLPFANLRLSSPSISFYKNPITEMTIMKFCFERFYFSYALDKNSYPRYSKRLLDYMSEEVAYRMVENVREHVAKEVRKIYEENFKENDQYNF